MRTSLQQLRLNKKLLKGKNQKKYFWLRLRLIVIPLEGLISSQNLP
jgi:hypothetical protein